MKATPALPSLSVLAVVALLSSGSAQACMGGMSMFSAGAPGPDACATTQVPSQVQIQPKSCLQGGAQGQSCGLINPELMAAVGDMAAGGMQIATHMMRVLAEEVSRYAALGDEPR